MPTYQYTCTSCGEPLEAVQSFSDDPLTECPACGGRLRKVFSAVGIVFKGSGFYRTDSRAGAGANGAAKDKDGAASKEPATASSDSSAGSNGSAKGSTSSGDGSSGSKSPAAAGAGAAKPSSTGGGS